MHVFEEAQLSEEQLQPIQDLYRRGLYLQAYRSALELAPLKEWTGAPARVLASRLLVYLGAPRLSLWHRLRAWRENPEHPEVRYYYAWTTLERKGPYDAWQLLKECGDMPDARDDVRSSWYAVHAQVAGLLRDFDVAESWLERALEVSPQTPWVHVARTALLEAEDKYDEALAAADHALSLQPWFRPAVQSRAHILTLLGRDDDAFECLQEAVKHLECSAIHWQLAGIYFEREEFSEVQRALELFEEYSPMLEGHFAQAFHSLRSYLAYRLGDDESAIRWARKSGSEITQKVADRLEDPERKNRARVMLPVGFVRQHHRTCAPATLATISRYWSMPAEHLQVAEEICYNGTSAFAERRWAEENGWVVKEFTVTEDSAEQMIDAGVPFTLTTTDPGNGHLQAVIGYDGRRGSVIIRDPYTPSRQEAFVDLLLEEYRAFGPRGMALVPEAESERLAGLSLPDTDLWALLHKFDWALTEHRRDAAEEILAELVERAPDDPLRFHADRRLALYDANQADELSAVENLLKLFPDNAVLDLTRLSLLRHLGKRDERLETLDRLCAEHDVHPAFLLQYAQELAQDARQQDKASDLLRRAIRANPQDPGSYYVLAQIYWDRQRYQDALELYRIAACLDDKDEQLAEAFFHAAQYCQETESALSWLKRRFERFGDKSSLPARTLEWALCGLERTPEALEVLEDALKKRPDDGDLCLHVANAYSSASGDYAERAAELLEQARDRCPRAHWLRGASRLASIQGDQETALKHYQEVLSLQPLAVDAHHAVADLLSELKSTSAALDHLRAAVQRFPHHQPLLQLWIQWLRDEPSDVVEPVIRQLIELNPANAWAVRELGFLLVQQGRLDEAEEFAEEAERLDPTHSSCHNLRGDLLAAQGNLPEARTAYREALCLSVDDSYAFGELLRGCDTPEERRQELEFVRQELVKQVIYGDGLLAYRGYAHHVLDPDELLSALQGALETRPDLWHAWSACIHQLISMERLDEALKLASEATERFPLLPRLWLDRSAVSRAARHGTEELESLEAAYRINPHWSDVLRPLSQIYERRGDLDRARSLLESAVTRDPMNGVNRGWLAEILWRQDDREAAFDQMERAVELTPGYEWAWGMLNEWAHEMEQPERVEEAARRVVASRPGEARSWLILEKTLYREEDFDECLAALDQAVTLNPRCVEAYSRRASLLTAVGRFDEAIEACRPSVWGDHIPAELQTRAAWVLYQQGRVDEAIAELHQSIEADHSQYGAWQQLAEWMREQGDMEAYLQAAESMARLDPYGEVSLGFYGEALFQNDQRNAAKNAFRRAYDIEPSYHFGGLWLLDLQLEDDELDEATETLARLQTYCDSPYVAARAIQIAIRQNDKPTAQAAFEELCLTNMESDWPLRSSFELLCEANWTDEVDAVIRKCLTNPDVFPEVGALWAERRFAKGSRSAEKQLQKLMALDKNGDGPKMGERAVHAWIGQLAAMPDWNHFNRFVSQNAQWLQKSTQNWGAVTWGWTLIRKFDRGLKWCERWQKYPDAEIWMLVNVAETFRAFERDEEAAEVSRHALSIPPTHGMALHQLWLACDDFLAGDIDQMIERLRTIDSSELDEDYGFLYYLLTFMLELADSPPAQRKATFARMRGLIAEMAAEYSNIHEEVARKRFYFDCLDWIAREIPGFGVKLWVWKRKFAARDR